MKRAIFCSILAAAALAAGCNKGTTTSPSTTTAATTTTTTTTTDSFDGALAVGGTDVFSVDVGQTGTVNVVLVSVGGARVPSTVQLKLGIGTFTDSGCSTTVTAIARSSASIAVSASETPGTYCVQVSDPGNLAGPASFSINVAHS